MATISGVEGQFNVMNNNPNLDLDLSEQNLVGDCCPAGDCGGGNLGGAYSYIQDVGVVSESCYPYTPGTGNDNCTRYMCGPPNNRKWKIVRGGIGNDMAEIKAYVMDYGPVATAACAADGMASAGSSVITCQSSQCINRWIIWPILYVRGYNHAIAIVGWNDTELAPGGGYWITKGTWGTGVGDGGYHYYAYGGGCFMPDLTEVATGVISPP
jgi:hypothetical protein